MNVRNLIDDQLSLGDLQITLAPAGDPAGHDVRPVDIDSARQSDSLREALAADPPMVVLEDMTDEEKIEMGFENPVTQGMASADKAGGQTPVTSAGGSANQPHGLGSANAYTLGAALEDGGHSDARLFTVKGTNTVKFLIRDNTGALVDCSGMNEKVNWLGFKI